MSNIMIPIEDILAKRKHFKSTSTWPSRETENRLEPEAWPIIRPKFTLGHAKKIFTIGSCFARNIEEHLSKAGFELPTLSFAVPESEWTGRRNGILNKFTPGSILQEIEWTAKMLDCETDQEREKLLREPLLSISDADEVIDLELAGFRAVSMQRATERRTQLFGLTRQLFDSDVVIITFGLAEAWWDAERGKYIQQTPSGSWLRQYPGRFLFRLMDFSESFEIANKIVDILTARNPSIRLLITTSPVPIGTTFTEEDILISNTYAKSMLRTVCGELAAMHSKVAYFPSYESVMLTKSPNVWADDLLHVRDQFVCKIVQSVLLSYFEKEPV